VPLPWTSDPKGGFGFSTKDSLQLNETWLPQSPWMGKFAVDTQDGVEDSTLTMYRKALAIRKSEAGLGDGPMEWIEAGTNVVAFKRPGDFACYINFGAPTELPSNSQILVSSGPVTGLTLPTDTAVWVRLIP
jgi:alpha-glucosidase